MFGAGLLVLLFHAAGAVSVQERGGVPPPELVIDSPSPSRAGHARLLWVPDATLLERDDIVFELQQATREDFSDARALYRGPDMASVVSGLEDGTYYYRVRAAVAETDADEVGPWSDPEVLVVEHHPLQLAILLMIVGGLVFAATVAVVIHGVLTAGREDVAKA